MRSGLLFLCDCIQSGVAGAVPYSSKVCDRLSLAALCVFISHCALDVPIFILREHYNVIKQRAGFLLTVWLSQLLLLTVAKLLASGHCT